MWKTEFKYGICGGLAICAYKYIEYLSFFQAARLESGVYTGLFTYVIVITVIILGVKARRDKEEHNLISFREAFQTGMVIAIFMALIAAPFMYAHASYINPHEADDMIKYITANPGDEKPPTPDEIHAYYAPGHRALRIGEYIILTGILISLFSAGMFRRAPADLDLARKPKLPSTLKKVYLVGTILTSFTMLVYLAWVLKYENVTDYLYDYLVDPIGAGILQVGTAILALMSLVLNIVYYNRLSHYRRSHNIWNMLMIFISGVLFFVFLWTIFSPARSASINKELFISTLYLS